MRPETLKENALVIILVIIAFFSHLAVEFQWFNNLTIFRILKYLTIPIALIFGIRYFLRRRPYQKAVTKDLWIQSEHISSHKDVFVKIPANQHKKGTDLQIEIRDLGLIKKAHTVDYEILTNGDVLIYHKENSFMPPWAELKISIRGMS